MMNITYAPYIDAKSPMKNSPVIRKNKGPYLLVLVQSKISNERFIYAYNIDLTMHEAFLFKINCTIC